MLHMIDPHAQPYSKQLRSQDSRWPAHSAAIPIGPIDDRIPGTYGAGAAGLM